MRRLSRRLSIRCCSPSNALCRRVMAVSVSRLCLPCELLRPLCFACNGARFVESMASLLSCCAWMFPRPVGHSAARVSQPRGGEGTLSSLPKKLERPLTVPISAPFSSPAFLPRSTTGMSVNALRQPWLASRARCNVAPCPAPSCQGSATVGRRRFHRTALVLFDVRAAYYDWFAN